MATFPVDVLYTWTGERAANEHMRFADHGELKHSLRSVAQFMPWVRHIFIVMNKKKKPSWFADHYQSRVTVLDHDDIFVDEIPVVKPVTNSNSIETAISNAPGLAEHFVYFNDDFFVARPLARNHFFTDNGRAVVRARHELVDTKNSAFPGLPLTKGFHAHTPLALRKSAYQSFKAAFPTYIAWIRKENKRTGLGCDRCPEAGLPCPCMQAVHGTFAQYMLDNGFAVHGDSQAEDTSANYFNHENYTDLVSIKRVEDIRSDTFTINDSAETNRQAFGEAVAAFLARVFPMPAPFEAAPGPEKLSGAFDSKTTIGLAVTACALLLFLILLLLLLRR